MRFTTKTLVLILLIVVVPFTVIAKEVFIAFDWTGIAQTPKYLRYQVDSEEGQWIDADATAKGILLELDDSVAHVVYVQASYDSIVYSRSSVAQIPQKAVEVAPEAETPAEPVVQKTEAVKPEKAEAMPKSKSTFNIDGSFSMKKVEGGYAKAVGLSLGQDFFLGGGDFGVGYQVGALWNWEKKMIFGAKLGLDLAYRIDKVQIVLGGGAVGEMDFTDATTRKKLGLSAYGEAGLRFALSDSFSIGAKFTYVYPLKDFLL